MRGQYYRRWCKSRGEECFRHTEKILALLRENKTINTGVEIFLCVTRMASGYKTLA